MRLSQEKVSFFRSAPLTLYVCLIVVFEQLKSDLSDSIQRCLHSLDKKSSIKDVCALLDLKASKYNAQPSQWVSLIVDIVDVNKALEEMHEAVGEKVPHHEYALRLTELQRVD